MSKRHRLALVMLCLAPSGVLAQDASGVIERISQCRTVDNDAERLRCFDRSAAELASVKGTKGLVILDRQQVREKRRSLFGLKLPDIDLFGREEAKDAPIAEIDTTLASIRSIGRDRLMMRFGDGSTWRSIEPARNVPEPGDKVKIKRAAMGTYRAAFGGDYPIRVERVE